MGMRFHKTIKLGKSGKLNISKKSISASKKIGWLTFNSKGLITFNIPGTGISFTKHFKKNSKKGKKLK